MRSLFRIKPLDRLLGETEQPGSRLKRSLGPFQLTSLGLGAIIGGGIFSTAGTAAAGGPGHLGAGPALIISFMVVAVACSFAALCYAELAAMVPMAGSAYTYAYATLGELVAWILGWDLILEYAIGNVAVAISWSAYFQELMRGLHCDWPTWLGTDFRSAVQAAHQVANALGQHLDPATLGATVLRDAQAWKEAPHVLGLPIIFNLPAFAVVAAITWILVIGIRETAWFNTALVVTKLVIIVFFLGMGVCYVRPENWTPFAPNGWAGISAAAAIIFFAYIGFDAVSTAAEEAKNPQRDLPIGIIASLIVSTVVYMAVAVVLTGLEKWQRLGTAEPLAAVFSERGLNWVAGVISLGALVATTSVLVPFQVGQSRIFFAMARDGLLPSWAARVHPRYGTPHVTTFWTGVVVAVFSAITNINEMVELCNIGTLLAFILVAVGVMILRRTHADRPRPFRARWVPLVPIGAILCCGYLMAQLPAVTWRWFFYWLVAGLLLYAFYGVWHSRLRRDRPGSKPAK